MNPASGMAMKWIHGLVKNIIFIELCMNPASGMTMKWIHGLVKNTIFIEFCIIQPREWLWNEFAALQEKHDFYWISQESSFRNDHEMDSRPYKKADFYRFANFVCAPLTIRSQSAHNKNLQSELCPFWAIFVWFFEVYGVLFFNVFLLFFVLFFKYS